MKLVVAEKHSVGTEIAAVLGANSDKKSYMEGNGYIVSWCRGHLVGLCDPESYSDELKSWAVDTLPIIPEKWRFEIQKSSSAQYKVLKELLNRSDVDEVICATDAGREGECIFRYVYKLCKCDKPVMRLWISSVERSEIESGFENLLPDSDYDNLYRAGFARTKADWLVGMNFTRLFSCVYNARLSVGRVQTPTLALIVDRENEINNFVSQKYYTILLNFDEFTAESDRFDNQFIAQEMLSRCNSSSAFIREVNRENKKVNAPKLFNLADLQKTANRLLGYTAQQTLDIAQDLYEKKLITYPRTDSNYANSSMEEKLLKLIPLSISFMHTNIYSPDVTVVINDKKVTDHHAILPTVNIDNGGAVSALLPSHLKLLQLICSQLLCATASPYIYEQTVLKIACGGLDFTAKGNKIVSKGFKEIQNHCTKLVTNKPIEVTENILPDDLTEGMELTKISCGISEHQTTPPKRFTDATLIAAMERAGNEDYEDETAEKKGIGTQATQAGIIERIIANKYVERKGKNLVPTDKGIKLIQIVPEEVKSPKMTAEWECKLQQIEKGGYSDSKFMNGINAFVSDMVSHYKQVQNEKTVTVSFETDNNGIGQCPKCGGTVAENTKAFSCKNRECDFVIWKSISGKKITESLAKSLIQNRKTKMLKGFTSKKTGKEYSARLKLDGDYKVVFEFD